VTVAVVGAGLAGLRTCEALRKHGFDGDLVLIGAEPHLPYDRPPLSKEVLRGDRDVAAATLRSADELAALDIDLRLGCAAARLAVDEREVVLSDGATIGYDDVVIATGATPRALPGLDGPGVHVLRTAEDCVALRDALTVGARVVVVGAGFIGLEVAASARARGCDVTVVDMLPAPLARVLDPAFGAAMARLHAAHGVDVRCGAGVVAADPANRRVVLTDGSTLDADVVVVGIGVAPSTGWLADSGLTLDDGVVCDAALRAAPGVWAVGDVARWHAEPLGAQVRVEHWTNATEQPDHVGRNIAAGAVETFESVPYFWSDQYDAKLQCLGFSGCGDDLRVVRGALDEPKFVALIRRGDRLGGVVGLRSPGQVMKLRPLLAAHASWAQALEAAG
jgi:NADPH-dependent 2,4-dienoyl-CoA reductase/sulfur reductase-like enzyme